MARRRDAADGWWAAAGPARVGRLPAPVAISPIAPNYRLSASLHVDSCNKLAIVAESTIPDLQKARSAPSEAYYHMTEA